MSRSSRRRQLREDKRILGVPLTWEDGDIPDKCEEDHTPDGDDEGRRGVQEDVEYEPGLRPYLPSTRVVDPGSDA
jgi:hypothetical protein